LNKRLFEAFDPLGERGYAVVDDFLTNKEVTALRARIDLLQDEGRFRKAGIGKMQHHTIDRSFRGDMIFWINSSSSGLVTPESSLNQKVEKLRAWLNRYYFLGLKDHEAHLAFYPPGTFYKRHTDRFVQQQHRVLSVVIYLNENWSEVDGGQLVIYPDEATSVGIEPISGRLVVFKSELEHEVLPTHSGRYSMTGWLLDQEVGLTFL
jgi:SM-20-related protein